MDEEEKKHLLVLTEALVRMGYVNYIADEAVKNELLREKKDDYTKRLYIEKDGNKGFVRADYGCYPTAEGFKTSFNFHEIEENEEPLSKSNYRFVTFSGSSAYITPYAIIGPEEKEIVKKELSSKLPELVEDERIKTALKKFNITFELKNIDTDPILYELYKSMDSNGLVDNEIVKKNGNLHVQRGIEEKRKIYLLKKEKCPSLEENFYTYTFFDGLPCSDKCRRILGSSYYISFGGLFKHISLEDELDIDKNFMKRLIKPFFRKYGDYGDTNLDFNAKKADFSGYRIKFDMPVAESIFELPLSRQNFEANSFILNHIDDKNKSRLYNFLIEKYDKNSEFPIEKHVSLIHRKNMNRFTDVLEDYLANNKVPSNSIREKKLLGILEANKSYFLDEYSKGPEEFDRFMQSSSIHTQHMAVQQVLDLPKNKRNPATEKLISDKYPSLIADTYRKGVNR